MSSPAAELRSHPSETESPHPHRFLRRVPVAAALLVAALSSIWCFTAGRELGATHDEPVYVQSGLQRWRTGSHSQLMRIGTMPLPPDLTTLPIYLYERARGVPIASLEELGTMVPVARIPALIFWLLLLFYVWRIGSSLAGSWGGLCSLALISAEPTFLAHATLATTDIAASASLLAMVWHFRAGRQSSFLLRVAVPSLWFAAAVLCKASAVIFGPLCMIFSELLQSDRKLTIASSALNRKFLKELLQISGLGMLLVFIYCGSDWRAEPGFVVWANSLGPSSGASFVRWFASHLTIFTNAGDGLVRQIRHNVRGHGPEGTYLLGRIARSFWYYFPIATTIKMSPLFLLLPIAIAVRSPGALTVWPNLIAAGLFLLSPAYRVQIGIRLILPILSFAAAGIGASAALAIERGTRVTRFAIAAILAVGLLLNTAQLVSLWPDALVYSNSFWGGSRNGYRYLSDSNYDWGQGIPELREWQRTHPDVPMDVWYFGVDPALLSMAARNINLDLARGQSLPNLSRGHYLAASISFLFGASQSPEYDRTAEFLGTQRPIARTRTFFIYDFR